MTDDQADDQVNTADVFGAEPSLAGSLRDGVAQQRIRGELEAAQRDLNSDAGNVVYRLTERLGHGGMGVVYKAEQRSPIRRTVAIKVIKPGFDSAEVIARFESERQALARMDHPNIAKVLDADTDRQGRPYFVMEYVPGKSMTQYADDNRLSITQRLELMIQVCDAIGHAHAKAIIHRDIMGSHHPYTRNFATNLADCLDAQNRHDEAQAVRRDRDAATRPTTRSEALPASQP